MNRRAEYVAALRRERAHVVESGADRERLADIDRELDRYDPKPTQQVRETAVPGPTRRK